MMLLLDDVYLESWAVKSRNSCAETKIRLNSVAYGASCFFMSVVRIGTEQRLLRDLHIAFTAPCLDCGDTHSAAVLLSGY
jgi:hypothetical protein